MQTACRFIIVEFSGSSPAKTTHIEIDAIFFVVPWR